MSELLDNILTLVVACTVMFVLGLFIGLDMNREYIIKDCEVQGQFRDGDTVYRCSKAARVET